MSSEPPCWWDSWRGWAERTGYSDAEPFRASNKADRTVEQVCYSLATPGLGESCQKLTFLSLSHITFSWNKSAWECLGRQGRDCALNKPHKNIYFWRNLEASISFQCFLLHLKYFWNVDLLKGFILLPGVAFGSSWNGQRGFGSHIKGFKVNDFKYGWILFLLWWAKNLSHSLTSAQPTQFHLMLCD